MRRPTDTSPRTASVDRLVRLGVAAMPTSLESLEAHVRAMRDERMAPRPEFDVVRAGRATHRRGVLVASVVAAFIAMPSLALAGVLPDDVQRAAARLGDTVGINVPAPEREGIGGHRDRPRSDEADARGGGSNAANADAGIAPTTGRPAADRGHVNGERPGKPEDGEIRGKRFGQVEAGPDQGKAADAGSSRDVPVRPTATPVRPDTTGGRPAAPAPITTGETEPIVHVTPTPQPPSTQAPAPAPGANGAGNAGGGPKVR